MILGIGTDLTHIDRIEALLRRHGERFINRCFDALEITAAENSKKKSALRLRQKVGGQRSLRQSPRSRHY